MAVDPEVLDRLWAEVEPTVFITREQWDRGLAAGRVRRVPNDPLTPVLCQ